MSSRLHSGTLLLLALAPLSRAQSAGGSSPVPPGRGITPGTPSAGEEVPKPGGGSFFWDVNQQGRARELHLRGAAWGRLVDVHGLDALGAIDPQPVFRDFLIGATVQTDGVDSRLIHGHSTQLERLVILRQRGTSDFGDLLAAAAAAVVELDPRGEGSPPFPLLPRNAALELRFDDLLDDASPANLFDDVHVRVSVPSDTLPGIPFGARVLFDPNHGGLRGASFHSTRVLVDLTLSEFEAAQLSVPLPINAVGLPQGGTNAALPSVALRLPTVTNAGVGQFTVLTNLAGKALAQSGNGPIDLFSPTEDLVRAARAGNSSDANDGFLLDLERPYLLGQFPLRVDAAVDDPAGDPGFSFLLDWTFLAPCFGRPRAGDSVQAGNHTLDVIENGGAPSAGGVVLGVRVRLAQRTPTSAGALPGQGILATPFRSSGLNGACWFTILPQPLAPPAEGLSTTSRFVARFSEPLADESFDPYDAFRLVHGPAGTPADASHLVVADLLPSSEQTALALSPVLPLAHVQGVADEHVLELVAAALRDLAGNSAASLPGPVVLGIDPAEATETSAGIVLRLDGVDEVPAAGATDLRGQHFYDLVRGEITGRPPAFFSAGAVRTNPVPSLMIPFPQGVSTPLNPLGAKLHSVWRYCDLGWNVRDETKYDVDVVGLDWAPVGGTVIADFFPGFEIRLAHSSRLPDESLDSFLLPRWPTSGLIGRPDPFSVNVLADPLSPQQIVHPRALGYVVDPADLFLASTGTVMIPYPLNQGAGPLRSYTWRDTTVQSLAGPGNAGIPMDIEEGPPLFLEPTKGTIAPAGEVPSFGLPLLMEYRCYPTDLGLGLNAFDVSLAVNSSSLPAFRSYSAGGINTQGSAVTVDPDTESVPNGGYNPYSSPPGQRTPSRDNVFYIGQVDLAYRVSRVHSVWLDTQVAAPDFVLVQESPLAPGNGSVTVDLRGALGFTSAGSAPYDAFQIDAYGDITTGSVQFLGGNDDWSSAPDGADGARFVQLRLTLTNDLERGTRPALDYLALAFR